MKLLSRIGLILLPPLLTPVLALAQASQPDLAAYLATRDQLKAMDIGALKSIAASPSEKPTRRGLANYYLFLKSPGPGGDAVAGRKMVDALEEAANASMDPVSYVKLAQIYAQDSPGYGVAQDRVKTLKYLSIAWETADLSERASGNNALLTLIINNSLGLGDGLMADGASGKFDFKGALDFLGPGVLWERERFKKLYGLSVKDEFPGTTNLERHYGH